MRRSGNEKGSYGWGGACNCSQLLHNMSTQERKIQTGFFLFVCLELRMISPVAVAELSFC